MKYTHGLLTKKINVTKKENIYIFFTTIYCAIFSSYHIFRTIQNYHISRLLEIIFQESF